MGGGRYERPGCGPRGGSPPTLALPHMGGGDHKLICTNNLLLIQQYCDTPCEPDFTGEIAGAFIVTAEGWALSRPG